MVEESEFPRTYGAGIQAMDRAPNLHFILEPSVVAAASTDSIRKDVTVGGAAWTGQSAQAWSGYIGHVAQEFDGGVKVLREVFPALVRYAGQIEPVRARYDEATGRAAAYRKAAAALRGGQGTVRDSTQGEVWYRRIYGELAGWAIGVQGEEAQRAAARLDAMAADQDRIAAQALAEGRDMARRMASAMAEFTKRVQTLMRFGLPASASDDDVDEARMDRVKAMAEPLLDGLDLTSPTAIAAAATAVGSNRRLGRRFQRTVIKEIRLKGVTGENGRVYDVKIRFGGITKTVGVQPDALDGNIVIEVKRKLFRWSAPLKLTPQLRGEIGLAGKGRFVMIINDIAKLDDELKKMLAKENALLLTRVGPETYQEPSGRTWKVGPEGWTEIDASGRPMGPPTERGPVPAPTRPRPGVAPRPPGFTRPPPPIRR